MKSFHQGIKQFRRWAARQGMFFSTGLFLHLPYPVVRWIMRLFVGIAFCLTWRLKRIARDSLIIAFGEELSRPEREKIIKACFENLGRGMIEMVYYTLHPEMIKDQIEIEGLEHLDAALKKGRGVIGLTAHFGNFPLMMLKIIQLGYKGKVLMRHTRDPEIDQLLFDHRTRLGLGTIYSEPRRQCVQESLKTLRNNEILFMLMDQHFGREGGVVVDFFNRPAATAPGVVVFAERSGAAVVPIFIRRLGGDRHRITVFPEVPLEHGATPEETIQRNVARFSKIIEDQIRRYPSEWGWMHRRWKGRETTHDMG